LSPIKHTAGLVDCLTNISI